MRTAALCPKFKAISHANWAYNKVIRLVAWIQPDFIYCMSQAKVAFDFSLQYWLIECSQVPQFVPVAPGQSWKDQDCIYRKMDWMV